MPRGGNNVNKRIIKKHMKNGLSRNRLERENRELKTKIGWDERTINYQDKEIENLEREYKQLAETYRETLNESVKRTDILIKKIESRQKINEGLKNTIEDMIKTRYDERAAEARLKHELDEEIRELQEENSEMRAELLRIREKEENSGIVQKMMRRAFNL